MKHLFVRHRSHVEKNAPRLILRRTGINAFLVLSKDVNCKARTSKMICFPVVLRTQFHMLHRNISQKEGPVGWLDNARVFLGDRDPGSETLVLLLFKDLFTTQSMRLRKTIQRLSSY